MIQFLTQPEMKGENHEIPNIINTYHFLMSYNLSAKKCKILTSINLDQIEQIEK